MERSSISLERRMNIGLKMERILVLFPSFSFLRAIFTKNRIADENFRSEGEENFRFSRKIEGKIEVSEGGNEKRVKIEGEVNNPLRRRG